jgi:hypothetical protein
MKSARKNILILGLTVMMSTFTSCELFDLDINTDPNSPTQASVGLLLTNVELNASSVFANDLNESTMGFMGITASTDDFNMTNASWANTWDYLWANPLKDLDGIIKATAEQRANGAPNPHYEGIAKVLKAYYFSLMVDLWGDVPYSQAFAGDSKEEQILVPAFDDDKVIYDNLLVLLDEAVAHFAETTPVTVTGDVIYGGNAARWAAAARSLKLKLLLQISRSDNTAKAKIDALINAAGTAPLITAAAGDFQFMFGTLSNPDDRHPGYQDGYAGGEAGYTYFGHQYMYEMLAKDNTLGTPTAGSAKGDPRAPFYFKRQTSTVLDPSDPTQKQTIPCSQRTDCKYGYFPLSNFVARGVYNVDAEDLSDGQKARLAGFFGRDRSDPSGVPNDNPLRTTVGVYPNAGLYDDVPEAGGGNKGRGSGIFPMLTSWMVKIHQAEAVLALGSPGNARTLFQGAMTDQFAKVSAFGLAMDGDAVAITANNRDRYISARLAEFDAAPDNNAKLRVVLKEAWFLNFGNGFEIYNTFRRTGLPNDLQTPLQRPRQFALRLPYGLNEVNLNPNTPAVVYDSPGSAVFWDVLKFQF